MTDINLKSMPATAAKTQPQALKGRHHVMHGYNPCNTPRLTKTLLLALLLALLAPGAANAQNRTIVTIGVGTYTHNFPLPGFYAYHYSVYLYTPSAAPALDIDCDISSIAFNVSTNSTKTGARMYIWVKDVDADYALAEATTFSQYTAGATQVYENDDFSSTLGWNTFAFTSDFSHEGGKALLVAVYGVGCSDIGGCQRRCYYTTAPNTFWSKHADLNDPGTNVSGSVDERRADIQLNLTYTGCLSPSGLAVSNITDNSATLSWTETGEATAWQICVNDDEENLIDADTNPYTLTGLTPETEYTVKVRANCGSEQSAWSNGLTFTTPCGAFALPYSYGFEDAGDLNCWEVIATSPYTGITTANDAPEGEKVFLFYYNERNAYLASPVFSGTEQGLDVAFQYMNSSTTTNYTEQFQVGYTTDAGAAPADFTYGETIYGENHWVMYENTFPPNTKRIAIKYIYTYGMYLRLDDFNFESTSCPIPTDLTAGTPEPHSVELGWTETGEATAWQICVNDDEENLIDADTNPYTLTGLNPVTEYTVKVRANCGAEQSAWSTGLTFTTLEACPVPFDVAASDIAPTEVAISWTGYSDSYNLSYRRVPSTAEPLLSEGFEGGTMPQGWIIEGASQDPAKTWRVGVGDHFSETGTHSGNYNALITHNTSNQVTYLVMPALDLGEYGSAELSFWYINKRWGNDTDEFAVCYRIGSNGGWNELWSTTENHQAWTSQTVALTGLADGYQIGFRFTDHYGYGVGLDDIALSGVSSNPSWITLSEAESPQAIASLRPETEYEVKVQGVCDGIPTEWSQPVTFTTLEACPVPFDVEMSDITPTEVAISWTGFSDSYNLSYRRVPSMGPETLLSQGFEDGTMPQGWTIEGDNQDPARTWRVGVGDYNTGTGTHSGSYNALITHIATNQVTYLVMPALDLGEYGSAELSFWYINRKWGSDIDEFAVCYRIGNGGEWNELWSTAENHQGWTSQSVELTGLADNYQIGFRFTDHYGYGVGLDDIALSGVSSNPSWITLSEAESPQAIASLRPETEYEVKVLGICDGIPTEWSESVYFSTPACTVNNLEVSDITATGATLTWTGTSVDYNVRVGTFLGSEMMVDEDFAEAIPADWDNNSDYPWTIVDGHMQSSNGGIYSTSSAISLTLTFPFGGTIDFDAECMGEGGGHSSVFDMCIFTIDGEQQFCYGDNMPGWNHYSYLVNAGEHTFTWSYTKDNSIQPPGDYFAVDNVVAVAFYYSWDAPLLASGESITFSALTPSTTYYAQVQGNCIPTGWSDIVTFTTLEQTAVTQTTTLTAGWNWWSTYLDITLDDLKAALVEALPGTTITIKSRNNGYTTYNGSMWRGALSSLDVTQMYMIQASTACEIMLQGMPINPAEHTVTIRPGVNWIAFPLGASMSVTNAFAGFAVANDAIKSKSNGYTTFNGTMWRGSLNTLQPGAGYIYQSNSTVNRFFNFPTGAK